MAFGGKIKGRRTVDSLIDLIDYMDKQDYIDCYANIFANWQIRTRKVDVVFLDVDDHDGENKEGYLKDCVVDILNSYGYGYDLYFTGRGYHFYLRFPDMRIEDYNNAVKNWANDIGLNDYVDVVGNINQLARLPKSFNSKTGTDMKLIKTGNVNNDLGNEILTFAKTKNIINKTNNSGLLRDVVNIDEFPDCMKVAVDLLGKTGELEHFWRVALGIFLIKTVGFEKAHNIFSLASDYDWSKTEQQLQFLNKKQYKCYSCKKMRMMGMCRYVRYKDCPFGLLSNGWLEEIV